jgi:nitrogenase subunit NifH
MFSNKIKDFIIKNNVKKRLSNVKHLASNDVIKTIGIIFDESESNDKEGVIKEIQKFGFQPSQIDFIVFREKIKKTEVFNYPVFSMKDINWNASFEKNEIKQFVDKNFDLLISYYDVEKPALVLLTHNSKANFKVGFANVDNRLYHFMIQSDTKNKVVFTEELFKYLKILKKI